MAENGTSRHSVGRNPRYSAVAPSRWTMDRNSWYSPGGDCAAAVAVVTIGVAAWRVRTYSNGAVTVEETNRAEAPANKG